MADVRSYWGTALVGRTLWAGEKQIGRGTMPRTVPVSFSTYAGTDISRDNGLVVDLVYEDKAPYAFTGTVKQDQRGLDFRGRRGGHPVPISPVIVGSSSA